MTDVYKGSDSFTCDPVAGAIQYNFRVYDDGADLATATPVAQVTQAGNTVLAATLAPLLPAGAYDVYVRAQDSLNDWGPLSSVLDINLILGPKAPTNLRVA